MDRYKATDLHEFSKEYVALGGYDQLCKDCDYVVKHLFQGNWTYPNLSEYTLLSKALLFGVGGPENVDSVAGMGDRLENIYSACATILRTYQELGAKRTKFYLEDVMNLKVDDDDP